MSGSNYIMTNCTLEKGKCLVDTWIPSTFADVGHKLQLREDKDWSDGWEVKTVKESTPVDSISSPVVMESRQV